VMRSRAPLFLLLAGLLVAPACGDQHATEPEPERTAAPAVAAAKDAGPAAQPKEPTDMSQPVRRSEEEWRKSLTPEQFHVLREKGTERAFTGRYWDTSTPGVYRCAGCGAELFRSDAKFDSGCGWPSFDKAIADGRIVETEDRSLGMIRTEVTCARCGGHLGHLFDDGPTDTGMRYCINSVSIDLVPDSGARDDAKPAK